MSDYDAMRELLRPRHRKTGEIHGVVIGIVTNNEDKDGLGRVKVTFPWLPGSHESAWARVGTPMAGNKMGMFFLPEVDSEVLVVFEHGRVDRPIVIGALWNGKDAPPTDNSNGENNLRIIKSRSGHTITLDDTDGAEKITIEDGKQKNTIVLDAANNTLEIKSEGDLTIDVKGKLTLKSGDDLEIQAGGKLALKSDGGQASIKASIVNLNDGKLKVQ